MFATTNACAMLGVDAVPVQVEASYATGLPQLTIIGMREADAREARERLRCGLTSVGVDLARRITVSLAPADIPKSGASMDLPMALAILAAMKHVPPHSVRDIASRAEIGLDGRLRPSPGTVASVLRAVDEGWREILVADDIYDSVRHLSAAIVPVASLADAIAYLRSGQPSVRPRRSTSAGAHSAMRAEPAPTAINARPDMSDVRGQQTAVEALCVAAAGAHNILLYGPPGCGKSMLAHRLTGLLPQLDAREALEVAAIHDAAGSAFGLVQGVDRTFRAPHHSISQAALIGGGSVRPIIGELTLAHRGVLFLDELPEFRPSCIDALRQPLEEHEVRIRRIDWSVRFPCTTQVIAAMNLCRCGRRGSNAGHACSCTNASVSAYQSRVSGAILDRFDVRLRMHLPSAPISSFPAGAPSSELRSSVIKARELQYERWGDGIVNAQIRQTDDHRFGLTNRALRLLRDIALRRGLSGRTQASIIRVARTVADLAQAASISTDHLIAAVSLAADEMEPPDADSATRRSSSSQSSPRTPNRPAPVADDADQCVDEPPVLRKGEVARA